MEKTVNIMFCGTGGQGVLKASEIVSLAAMYDGFHTKKSEVHGMAQRGGSVESHVRYGKRVASPLIEEGQADFFVPFYKDEHDRLISYLSEGGKDFLTELESAHLACENKKFVNTYMLGRLSKYLNISQKSWLKALDAGFKGRFAEENRKVFLEARDEN